MKGSVDTPTPVVTPESLRTPEVLAGELVDRVERGLTELGVPPRETRGWGWCNFVPGVVVYCAENDAEQRDYSVDAKIYQVTDLHAAAAGIIGMEGYRTRPVSEKAFMHGVNVLAFEGQPFLVDLTFAQFFGHDGFLQQFEQGEKSGISNDNPLAQELVNKGYVPLTDETLQEYLRITTRDTDPDYIAGLKTDVFNAVSPLEIGSFVDETEDNLNSNLGNHQPAGD